MLSYVKKVALVRQNQNIAENLLDVVSYTTIIIRLYFVIGGNVKVS